MSWFLARAPLLAALTFAPVGAAQAAMLRWANNGDTGSMDPYTRQETVQLRSSPISTNRWPGAIGISPWSPLWP